jgi:hypothetical protein
MRFLYCLLLLGQIVGLSAEATTNKKTCIVDWDIHDPSHPLRQAVRLPLGTPPLYPNFDRSVNARELYKYRRIETRAEASVAPSLSRSHPLRQSMTSAGLEALRRSEPWGGAPASGPVVPALSPGSPGDRDRQSTLPRFAFGAASISTINSMGSRHTLNSSIGSDHTLGSSGGSSGFSCRGAGCGTSADSHPRVAVPAGSTGHFPLSDFDITNIANDSHCNCSRAYDPSTGLRFRKDPCHYTEDCSHPLCDRSADTLVFGGMSVNGSEKSFDINAIASPTDKHQLKDRLPLSDKFQNPFSPFTGDSSDAGTAFLPWPVLPLGREPIPAFSEVALLKIFQDNVNLDSIHWSGTSIGPWINHLQKKLLEQIAYFSSQMCGGTKTSTKNIAAWRFIVIDGKGKATPFNPHGIEDLLFISGEAGKRCDESEEPTSCITSGFSGGAPLVVKQVMHRLNELVPHMLEPTPGKRMIVSAMPIIPEAKISVGEPTVAFSDCDIPSGLDKAGRLDHMKRSAKRGIDIAFQSFPKTSISILKAFTEPASLLKEEEDDDVKMMNHLFGMLKDNQIGQIFGHTEQAMARVFEDSVIPGLAAYHAAVSKEDSMSGVRAMIVVVDSLQDCCWWCQKVLAGLAGTRALPGFDYPINIHFVISGGKSFTSFYSATPSSDLVKANSRAHIVEVHGVNLAEVPVVFNYGELPESVVVGGAKGK